MTDAADKIAFTPEQIAEVFGGDAATLPANDAPVEEAKPANDDVEKSSTEPKVTDRITAAKRAELRAAREREQLEQRRQEIAAEKAANDARAADIKLFEEDPTAFIAKKGWGQKEVATFLEKLAGQHTPEAESDRKLTDNERRLKELEAKLAAKEAAERQQAEAAQIQAAEKSAAEAFIADISESADKYPHLTQEFSESEAVKEAFAGLRSVVGYDAEGKPVTRVRAFEAKHGRSPTHDEIAEYLDGIAKARIEARASASWGRKDKATEGSKPTLGQQDRAPPIKGSSPRTLSRTDASQRPSAPRNRGELTQEERDAASIAILERAMRAR